MSEYFERLGQRTQTDKAAKITEAVRMLEFAALRGDGQANDRHEKKIELISERRDSIGHFVEMDDSDETVWGRLVKALNIEDLWERRVRLDALRNDVGQRTVEVPKRLAYVVADNDFGLVRVPRNVSADYYDTATGWRRTA